MLTQTIIGRHEEREVGLHGQEIRAVKLAQGSGTCIRAVHGNIIGMEHSVHNARFGREKHRAGYRCIGCRTEYIIHYIYHTVIGQRNRVNQFLVCINRRVLALLEHGVGCIVHNGEILAGHTLVERFLHQVVDEELHDIQRNLSELFFKVIFCYIARSIAIHQSLTAAGAEILNHGIIGGHKHYAHILLL